MKKLILAIFLLAGLLPASAYTDLDTGMRVFLTRDPAGFVDGPNLYTYVNQNPWTHFDPEGLATEQDYQDDEAKAQAWHDQAMKDAGGNTKKEKQVESTYNSWVASDQKGIKGIEATAKKINQITDQYVSAMGEDEKSEKARLWSQNLDDSDPRYKQFNRDQAIAGTIDAVSTVLMAVLDPGAALDKTEAKGFVDLTDQQAAKHILDGDAKGGGHRFGTGISGKSEFPSTWSDAQVKHEVSDVATDPSIPWSKPDSRGYVTATGTRNGITIKVVIDTNARPVRIVTGYPTNTPRNP